MSSPEQPLDEEADRQLSQTFYRDYYSRVFNTDGFVGWSYRLTHRAVERMAQTTPGAAIMEIGAGQGEHLEYVSPTFESYTMVDLSSPPAKPPWLEDARVTWVQGDICTDIFEANSFDRVISMCVLHHLVDPVAAFRNIKSWLRPGGQFTFFLPSDPGALNRLNRGLFVTPRARRLGFDAYEVFNAREHHNHYWGLRHEILHQFSGYRIRRRYWPLGIPAADLSVFSTWSVTKPALDGDKSTGTST